MTEQSTVTQKALTYGEFTSLIFGFVQKHRLLVFLGFPTIFSLIWFPIVFSIDGIPDDNNELWGGLLFPFAISLCAFMCFGINTGNHAAKGNEQMFGCLLMIVIVPLLSIAYGIYRIVHFIITKAKSVKNVGSKTGGANTLETKVNQLNILLKDGLISKSDYDEQLSRLISKSDISL